jgi:hypothetical protein
MPEMAGLGRLGLGQAEQAGGRFGKLGSAGHLVPHRDRSSLHQAGGAVQP